MSRCYRELRVCPERSHFIQGFPGYFDSFAIFLFIFAIFRNYFANVHILADILNVLPIRLDFYIVYIFTCFHHNFVFLIFIFIPKC